MPETVTAPASPGRQRLTTSRVRAGIVGVMVAAVGTTAALAVVEVGNAVTIEGGAYYMLVSRHSGKAVDILNGSTGDGAAVVQWSRTGGTSQQFQLISDGGGYYRIKARHSGKVLDVRGAAKGDNVQVIQWPDKKSVNQQWKLVSSDTGYVRLVSRNSGKALDVTGWSTADGAALGQYTDRNTTNQQWSLVKVGGDAGPAPTASAASPTASPSAAPTTSPTVPPTPGPSTSAKPVDKKCADSDTITQGKYWINNNQWGKKDGSGTQCVWSTSTNGDTIGWSTEWDWKGKSNSVKSYASSVLGWHWGTKIGNTGLPVQVSANRRLDSTWKFAVHQDGVNTLNVSYDLWLHKINNPSWEDKPTDEIMVWLYRSNGAGPLGTKQTTVTIGGTQWDLYRGNIGWDVYSFVRVDNTTDSSLNLNDFLTDLVQRQWLDSSKYLNSVEAGTEVFTGKGSLETTAYNTTVR